MNSSGVGEAWACCEAASPRLRDQTLNRSGARDPAPMVIIRRGNRADTARNPLGKSRTRAPAGSPRAARALGSLVPAVAHEPADRAHLHERWVDRADQGPEVPRPPGASPPSQRGIVCGQDDRHPGAAPGRPRAFGSVVRAGRSPGGIRRRPRSQIPAEGEGLLAPSAVNRCEPLPLPRVLPLVESVRRHELQQRSCAGDLAEGGQPAHRLGPRVRRGAAAGPSALVLGGMSPQRIACRTTGLPVGRAPRTGIVCRPSATLY